MDDGDDRMLVPDAVSAPVNEERRAESVRSEQETLNNFQSIGITMIVFGLVSIVITSITVSTCWYYDCDLTSSGIWCGPFAITLGCLAITAKYHLNKGVVIANIVAASIASIFGLVNIVLSAISGFVSMWDDATPSVLSFCVCCLAIVWTTLTVHHLIVVVRILKSSREDSGCSPCCCLDPMAFRGGNGVPIAYVPRPQAPGLPAQTVFVAAPGYNTSQTV